MLLDVRDELEYHKDEEGIVDTACCVFAVAGDLFCVGMFSNGHLLYDYDSSKYYCFATVYYDLWINFYLVEFISSY